MKKKNSIITIFILTIIILLAIVFACIFIFSKVKPEQKITPQSTQTTGETTVKKMEGVVIEGGEFNTYRNEKFGFEFQFPKGWEAVEASFESYYSIFNVVLHPIDDWGIRFPILVNVVLPKFADTTYNSLEKTTSDTMVGGVKGIVHKYEKSGTNKTSYVLPLGEYKIILGSELTEGKIFDKFIESFKFLK